MVGGAAEPEDGSFDSFDEAVDGSGGGVWSNRGEAPPCDLGAAGLGRLAGPLRDAVRADREIISNIPLDVIFGEVVH